MPSLPSLSPAPAAVPSLAARAGRISVSGTLATAMAADRLRAEGRDLVDFGVGEPDFPTPDHIKEAGIAALRQDFTKYTSTAGILELRQAICAAHRRDFGSDYSPSEVLVTVGGKHALFNALSVLVDHGDEVVFPSPYWVSFRDQVTYAGGVPVIVPTDEARGFTLSLEAIARAVTPRTKVILLNSPANPSGAVFPPELFRGVLDLCRRHRLWLLSDECYAKFLYEGEPYSAAGEPESKDLLVVAGSFSKTYAMTGWRLGYALAPAALIQPMLNLQSHTTGNAAAFVQKAAIAACSGTQAPVARMLEEYRHRRDRMVAGLRAIPGIRCALPAGAFYAFPNVTALLGRPSGPATAPELAARLLDQAGVVTVPGEAFGIEGHLRFSYAASRAAIEEGLRRFADFCALLK